MIKAEIQRLEIAIIPIYRDRYCRYMGLRNGKLNVIGYLYKIISLKTNVTIRKVSYETEAAQL